MEKLYRGENVEIGKDDRKEPMMSKWVYDGYTKIHANSRKQMIERWIYRCPECGHTVRTEPTRSAILSYTNCPSCAADMKGSDNE